MLKQPIYVEFNLDAKVNSSKLIAISHVDDKYSETLEVAVKQNDRFVYMGGADVVARMVLHRDKDYLLSDNVACSVNDNGNIMIPFDNAVVKTSHGVVKIEVSITRGEDELTLQFPLWVSVNGSILETAEVTPDSEGTIPDLLREVRDLLAEAATLDDVFEILDSTLSGNPNVAPTLLIDSNVDQQYNPFGHLMVYYVDSNDVRHNLYDFYTTFVNMLKYRVVNSPDDATQIGVLYKTEISVDHDSQTVYVWCYENVSQFTQFAYLMNGHIAWRTKDKQTAWQPESDWGAWREIGGNYTELTNKPTINGITVEGAKVANSYQNIGDLKLLYYGRTQVFPYQHYELPMRSQSGLHSVYHDNSGYAFGDALVLNLLSYIDNFQRDDSSAVQGQICVQFKFLPCFDKSAPPKPLFRTKIVGSSDDSTAFSNWQELGITVKSAAVNNNGTITFTLSDGSAITTTGTSVIGPQGPAGANGQDGADGVSPTATVTQTATGATITVTDANGTTTANIANGQDYNLTAQDKSDIAALVLAQLPTTQGVQYGN